MLRIRQLGRGDEHVLATLAREDAEFDVAGRGRPRQPLASDAATAYLDDEHVLHWIAEADGIVVGHLLCLLQRRRVDDATQLLLYEIGVRDGHRRRGIGRRLMAQMEEWMRASGVRHVWVLADNAGATDFYAACGFSRDADQPVQLSRRIGGDSTP